MTLQEITKCAGRLLLVPFIAFQGLSAVASITLEGQNRGDTNTWASSNLQNWRELDYIPCRVHWTSARGSNQAVQIDFEHINGGGPGIQNLFYFSSSSNVAFSVAPKLVAASGANTWSYTFTVDILDNQPAFVYFFSRVAAGAHVNAGSSLAMSGKPSAMGNLQIHKPQPGPGTPDLSVLKTGPATAKPGDIISYTLSYTNKLGGTNTATGVQLSDILPPQVVVDPNALGAGGVLIGNTVYWDLPNLPPGSSGQLSFQAQVVSNAGFGVSFTNTAQILSAETELNYADNTAAFVTTTVTCAPPSVSLTPLNLAGCLGDSITLVPIANGTAPLAYQWRKNGSDISGATSSSYTIASLSSADAADYSVVVTNLCGSVTSSAVTLTVTVNVTATTLTNLKGCIGTAATFSTTASGTGPFSYQWYKESAALTGQSGASLTLSNLVDADSGIYSVVVSGGCGSSVSNSATLNVLPLPVITCATNKTVQTGDAWTFDAPVANYPIQVLGMATNTAGHCGGTFDVTSTWTATDSCGNSAQCSQTVTVVGSLGPLLDCSATGDKSVEIGTPWGFDAPTLLGTNITLAVLSTITNTANHCGDTFDATRTWQASDACGNRSTCTQKVTVLDTTAPVISCSSNKQVAVGSIWDFDAPTATDNGGAGVTIATLSSVTNTLGLCGNSFEVIRTWQATDACGNGSSCSQKVTVVDSTPRAINCSNTNKTVELGAPWSFNLPTATGDGTNLVVTVLTTQTNTTGRCGGTFEATRTWLATDECGNSAQCSQTVSVVDTTSPSVSIINPTNNSLFIAPASLALLADAQDAGGIITKVEFFSPTNNLGQATNGAPYFIVLTNVAAGSYTLAAVATDACGNRGTSAPVSITVIDRPPLSIVSAMQYNPQTDFVEQTVRITNPTYSTYNAVCVFVSNLTNSPAITVHNASGVTNGLPYVESHTQVLPGTYVDLRIEYYSPLRIFPNAVLRPELVAPSTASGAAVLGIGQHINRGLLLPNKTFLVEFASLSNRLYYVQYTSDINTWQTSQPALIGSGTWIQWLDNGQPKTDSAPASQNRRFYRVLLLP